MKQNATNRQMQKNWENKTPSDLCLDPESRICPAFDSESIAQFTVAAPGAMGFRVLDNCCEEHIQ